jgi:hypothetical protein
VTHRKEASSSSREVQTQTGRIRQCVLESAGQENDHWAKFCVVQKRKRHAEYLKWNRQEDQGRLAGSWNRNLGIPSDAFGWC